MSDEERDARWQEIMDAQTDFVEEPTQLDRARRTREHARDSKAQQFDEALSGFSGWSSAEPRRRRLSA
jgi:hypothetical protein